MPRRPCAAAFVLGLLLASGSVPAADAWDDLARPGAIALFRHANAPGVGDPPGFRPGDCATQRNLDDRGRAEARRIGEQFRSRGIRVGAVLNSRLCRTRETARLAFGSQARDEPAFDSFFALPPASGAAQSERARALLAAWRGPGALVVVTHQVNITALTGQGTASAQGVVVRVAPDGSLAVQGTIEP